MFFNLEYLWKDEGLKDYELLNKFIKELNFYVKVVNLIVKVWIYEVGVNWKLC